MCSAGPLIKEMQSKNLPNADIGEYLCKLGRRKNILPSLLLGISFVGALPSLCPQGLVCPQGNSVPLEQETWEGTPHPRAEDLGQHPSQWGRPGQCPPHSRADLGQHPPEQEPWRQCPLREDLGQCPPKRGRPGTAPPPSESKT